MSLAEGHSCLHAAQAFIQWNQLRIPGWICQAPSLCQDLHLVRPDQLNHWHETGKAGWAGRESFDSRSVVLSFKPLTGGLSQNGTTFSLIETLLPTGSLPTKVFSLFVPLFLHTKVFHNKTPTNINQSPPPYHPRKQNAAAQHGALSFSFKVGGSRRFAWCAFTPLHDWPCTGSALDRPQCQGASHWATSGPAPPRHD